MWCVKIGQHTFPRQKETKTPMSRHKSPLSVQTTLWLHCSQSPVLNRTSEWMEAIFPTRTSSQNEACAGCRGHLNWFFFKRPLHYNRWTQQAEKKSDIYCHRLLHKELKRDRRSGGGARGERQGVPLRWRWWMSGSQHILVEVFAFTEGAPQMTWLTAQLAYSTCTHPLNILLSGHVVVIAHCRYWNRSVKDCLKEEACVI